MGNQYLTGNNDGIIPEGDNVLWKFKSSGRIYNPVGVNDRVLVVSTDNYLYCLDLRDGSILWKFKAEGALTRMVVVYRGKVYLPSGRYITSTAWISRMAMFSGHGETRVSGFTVHPLWLKKGSSMEIARVSTAGNF